MLPEYQVRFHTWVDSWGVGVDRVVETASAVIAFGHRNHQPVVLKIVKRPGDEWHSGRACDAFAGRGVVRAIEHADGAILLERLVPGTPLVTEVRDDFRATAIIADVIQRMSPAQAPDTAPTVASCADAFDRYLAENTGHIPNSVVREAQRTYLELAASQGTTRLLHGDLHHYNVLLDEHRGWLAIDPKGVVGERAYELGAALRNPVERPDVFAVPATIEQRVSHFSRTFAIDAERILRWAFAQAVLAALWELEDNGVLTAGHGWLSLAKAIALIQGRRPHD
jgi:streptomycin 6-kinase